MSASTKDNTKNNSPSRVILAQGLSELNARELTGMLANMDFKIVMKKEGS